jgi:hypothetical protein
MRKESKKMAIDLKAIDLKQLKEEIKLLNETGDLESKIKVVGTSKEKLVEAFGAAVDFLDDKGKDIPDSCINFYNEIDWPAANAKEEEEPEESEAEAETEEQEEEKEEKKDKEKDKSKRKPPTPTKKITSFDDIKERLKEPANPTAYMDKLMLKGGKIETLIAKLKEYLTDNEISFSGFRTVSSVKRHIEYREEHGWVFEKDGDKVKLTGFKSKK